MSNQQLWQCGIDAYTLNDQLSKRGRGKSDVDQTEPNSQQISEQAQMLEDFLNSEEGALAFKLLETSSQSIVLASRRIYAEGGKYVIDTHRLVLGSTGLLVHLRQWQPTGLHNEKPAPYREPRVPTATEAIKMIASYGRWPVDQVVDIIRLRLNQIAHTGIMHTWIEDSGNH